LTAQTTSAKERRVVLYLELLTINAFTPSTITVSEISSLHSFQNIKDVLCSEKVSLKVSRRVPAVYENALLRAS
jgi:hypothetical protein